jgi:hypothetical protein
VEGFGNDFILVGIINEKFEMLRVCFGISMPSAEEEPQTTV